MIRKTRNGMQIFSALSTIHSSQLIRPQPTYDRESIRRRSQIEAFAEDYSTFLNRVRIAPEVVDEVITRAQKAGFYSSRGNYSEVSDDGCAFALVKPGKRPLEEGVRIIYSHVDSPCLRLKSDPVILVWDPDKQLLHTGIELDTVGYGGINPHQWTGQDLEVRGWSVINGKRRDVKLPVYVAEVCAHTDERPVDGSSVGDAFTQESLDLITGFATLPKLLRTLGFKGKEDYARSRLFAVPTTRATNLPHYIASYGHDDRSCVFTSLDAFLRADPKYTTVLFGFDNEEVGSFGDSGARGDFATRVLDEAFVRSRTVKSLRELSDAFKKSVFRKSLAINADTDVGATDKEKEENGIDIANVGKLGFGPFLNCTDGLNNGDQVSPRLIDSIMGVTKRRNIIFQPVGSPVVADKADGIETMSWYFESRGFPVVNIGLATGALHSPKEIVHKGDLWHARNLYKAILEEL